MPVKIYSSVRMGVSLQVNALSTLMLATVFLLTAAFRLLRLLFVPYYYLWGCAAFL